MTTKEVLEIVGQLSPKNTSFISSLGRTSKEAFRLFPNQTLFLDSMGDVSSIACGIALGLGNQHPVVALDTDGSHLMGITLLSTLSSIAHRLSNLLLIVMDNVLYEEGGINLPSRYASLNWPLLARAWGIELHVAMNQEQLKESIKGAFIRFSYVIAHIENIDPLPVAKRSLDGIESRYRFSNHLERLRENASKNLHYPSIRPNSRELSKIHPTHYIRRCKN